ncbi:hypothetical protein NLU13_2489 [Sarocladium strictum]|uniref:Haloacid dehalogenase n=1 Tax=Sarocladium strictum TaxID=5046 RepID=A0AA39GK96_SARSR|nr:hypothetical protein NLU13_2489 [Sarocladium strictum]
MVRPNLLLCFDAFGTLFRPKRNVALQYAEVARQCGLTNFSDDDLRTSFAAAFKREAKANPNYGRATGLGATQWWTNVIHRTFDPYLHSDQALPQDLAPRLLHRFSSEEGYVIEPDLVSSFRSLRTAQNSKHFSRIITGVITNSDDRVPDVLSSFGLQVSPLRYGMNGSPFKTSGHDIDFHCMSYDVGHEKPDRRIFSAAESMLDAILESQGVQLEASTHSDRKSDKWLKVYVGDEYEKDVVGSITAGWTAVLLDPQGDYTQYPLVEDHLHLSLRDATHRCPVLRVQSIRDLIQWITAQA